MKRWTALCSAMLLGSLALPPAILAAPSRPDPVASDPRAAPDWELSAVKVRIALSRALGEHAFLVMETMRMSAEPGPEFDAAAATLDENTADIAALVSSVLTEAEAGAFGQQWRNHIAYLVDYARAVAARDADAAGLAERQLQTYSREFSALLIDAFPNLPEHAVQQLVGEHVSQLEQVTDLADADYDAAYAAIRETYAHMFAIGDGLLIGITSRNDSELEGTETALGPAVDLRVTLDRLFGEHAYLAAIVMRARLDDEAHSAAAVAALERNSSELAEEVATIYGDEAGAAFERLWSRHTHLYVEYVAATAMGDESLQQRSLDGLADSRSDFSRFLADANPLIDAGALETMLATHTGHLVEQVGAYASGDYGQAYQMSRHAYAQTEELAAGLAGAIADQFPQLFPDTALPLVPPSAPLPPWASVLGLALAASAIGLGVSRWRGPAPLRGRRVVVR